MVQDFKILWLSNLKASSVPDQGYSSNVFVCTQLDIYNIMQNANLFMCSTVGKVKTTYRFKFL